MTHLPIQYIPCAIDYPTQAFKRLWNELQWDRRGSTPRREYYCNDVNVSLTPMALALVSEHMNQG